jgi:murein DD-endopeptidase MepM/ murein hydrolase activator NlpD
MAQTLVERCIGWLRETFPERQIYIRSDGRVRFYSFGPLLQATLATGGLLFVGWVAFASVNVLFKDHIIAANETRFQQMQAAYENRVAGLQLSYDEVNGALVASEDRFHAAANELQAKQNAIQGFLDSKHAADMALHAGGGAPLNVDTGPDNDENFVIPSNLQGGDPEDGMPASKPTVRHASFLGWGGTMGRIAGALFGRDRPQTRNPLSPAVVARHPILQNLAAETERVKTLSGGETALIARAEGQASGSVKQIQKLLRHAGVDPAKFEGRLSSAHGVGGPEIPLDSVRIRGISDTGFQHAYFDAYATLDQLTKLLKGMQRVPLSAPLDGRYECTSGFGPRLDPFTGRYAFHPGLDLAEPIGATVRAPASGTVVWAGEKSGYGKMVEINHGYGIRTRYGHLASISVKVGAKVNKGAQIGRLGSTGRSTGPHVHYEVWYDNVVKNPRNFIEAGRYVLKQG